MKGFIKVASAVPQVTVADVQSNLKSIVELCEQMDKEGVCLAVFPEMSLTGYTCGDLFHNSVILDASRDALLALA